MTKLQVGNYSSLSVFHFFLVGTIGLWWCHKWWHLSQDSENIHSAAFSLACSQPHSCLVCPHVKMFQQSAKVEPVSQLPDNEKVNGSVLISRFFFSCCPLWKPLAVKLSIKDLKLTPKGPQLLCMDVHEWNKHQEKWRVSLELSWNWNI